jgi:hypothetical protein
MFLLSARKFHNLLIVPAFLSIFFLGRTSPPDNQPPVANPDHYTVHNQFSSPDNSGLLANDNDPDGDPLSCVFAIVNTALGTAIINTNGRADFIAGYAKTGTVTVPYTVATTMARARAAQSRSMWLIKRRSLVQMNLLYTACSIPALLNHRPTGC